MFLRRSILGTTAATLIGSTAYMANEESKSDAEAPAAASTATASFDPASLASSPSGSYAMSAGYPAGANVSVRTIPAGARAVGPTVADPIEYFQFHVRRDWVLENWSYVTTLTNQSGVEGLRVPVATGTREQDIAGSLTYYFDAEKKLQRIAFHGTMGDPRLLTAFLVQTYQMEKVPTVQHNTELYQASWYGKAVSELRVRLADTVSHKNPHARYEVHLLLERPHPRVLFPPAGAGPVSTGFRL